MKGFDEYYDEAVEPGKRERAFAWATAIGLQDVDGLKPSKYLIKTAKRHIEGEITAAEARRLVDEYYETKLGYDVPADAKEADKVAARIVAIVNMPGFRLSPEYLIGLHAQIFDGVFAHAGKLREVQLTKKEWVLNGDTVEYAPYFDIERSLEYDFDKEKKFRYAGLSGDAKIAHFVAFISGIWQIHPFREGNTRTTGLFAIKYLQSRGYEVTNDLFYEKSWYFRNALVRANYENGKLNVEKTQLPLEEFFKVLLFGEEIELKNRFLRIGADYGSSVAAATGKLHRRDVGVKQKDVVVSPVDVAVNVVVKLTRNEDAAVHEILRDGKLTAAKLAGKLSVTPRQAQRILASLKKKAGLKRRGSDKAGEWYFVGVPCHMGISKQSKFQSGRI